MVQSLIQRRINDLITPAFNAAFKANLLVDDYELSAIAPAQPGAVKNTNATIRVVNVDSGYEGTRDIHYDRVDAMDFFYGTPKFLKLAGGQVDEYSVVAYLASNYGLTGIKVNHIKSVEIKAGVAVVTFADSSPIFTGTLRFDYYSQSIDLSELIFDGVLGALETPQLGETANISHYTYGMDLTYAKPIIDSLTVGNTAPQTLATALASVSGDPWVSFTDRATEYNLGEAVLVYKGPTGEADANNYPVNTSFATVAVFRLSNLCNNYSGLLTVNMK